ncbi:V-type proton ATPase subunit G-like isoform X2 [Euwallacea fornicatus]|uniref:V-type proton ATPase subunit G-like isoform X2 n=1 Tax=Euwallacea fornicatus TaxID=995702 RepID=UPI003390426A
MKHYISAGRTKRLRQAKEEARAEIEAYRLQRKRCYEEFERRHVGTNENALAETEMNTNLYVQNLAEVVTVRKDQIIKDLIALALDIHPQINPNFFILKSYNVI